MKATFLCLMFLITVTLAKAQQKVNDALLLDMYQNQHYAEAADYLKSVYQEPITDLKVLSRFGYTYQMAGKLPDALLYYQRIYEKDSANVPVLFNLANINLTRGNEAKSLGYFQKIIAIDSLNFTVNKQLGMLYYNQSDTVKTLKYLRKANTINPTEQEVASVLSGILSFQKNFKAADQILRKALAADSTNIPLLRSLMKLNYENSKYVETVKVCKTLLDLGDSSSNVYNKQGSSYFELKNYECCIYSFLKLPGIFQTERTYYLTAVSFKKLKDYNKCIEFLNNTLQQAISPNTYAYYSEMADTYQTMHQLKNAAKNYEKSVFFDEKPMILYTLATLYDQDLKDKRNALKYYKKYLDSRPPAKQKPYIDYVQGRLLALKN